MAVGLGFRGENVGKSGKRGAGKIASDPCKLSS